MLICYLLDELDTYEQDYSDALCPISQGADKSHLGEATLVAPLTTDEAWCMMQVHVRATYKAVQYACASWGFIFLSTAMANPLTHLLPPPITCNSPIPLNLHQPPPFLNDPNPIPSHPLLPMLHHPGISRDHRGRLVSVEFEQQTGQQPVNNPNPSHMAPTDLSQIIPPVQHGPDGWKQVVHDWEHPDPSRALEVALKDWQPSWYLGSQAASQPSSSLYAQRRLIATEIIDVYVLIMSNLNPHFAYKFSF